MANDIKTEKLLIKDVFERWFCVPEYQRPYVWGKEEVADLLDDISDALSSRPSSEYFLGSIVFQTKLVKSNNGPDFEEHDLLDGQQRLTTCLLLHAVGRDLATHPQLKESCHKAVFQQENEFDGIPERIRIVYDIRPEVLAFIQKYLQKLQGTDQEDGLRNEAQNAKDVTVRHMAAAVLQIREFFKAPENPSVEKFFPFFRNRVLLIYVASGELEDAFRLFTVLNDRGMKLGNSDIIKSKNLRALRDAKATEVEVRDAARLWEELEGELSDEFDTFLSHIRTVLVRERAKQGLLQEFEQVVYAKGHLQPGRETFDCVRRFRDHYADILNGDHQVELESWEFDNILTLLREAGRADFWVPPVLYFLDIYGHHRITAFMKKLENKFSGDWFLRGTPTSRIEAMNRILRKIYEIEQKGGMKDDKIDSLLSSDVFSVDTVELFRRLDHWPIYGQPYGAYLLLKIDMITGGPTNRLQPPRQISVEHVLPQNPAGNSKWCADFSDIEREEWTNRLGNLVLIGRRKNASLGRRDFGEKKTRYFSSHVQTFASAMKVMKEVDWTPGTLQQFHQERIIDLKSYFA